MRIGQHLQSMEILSTDDRVERLIPTALDPTGLNEPGVDVIPELRHHNYVGHQLRSGLGLFALGSLHKFRCPALALAFETGDRPKPPVAL